MKANDLDLVRDVGLCAFIIIRKTRGWRKRKRDTKVKAREETSVKTVKTDGFLERLSVTKATAMNESRFEMDGTPMTKTTTTLGVLDDDEPS